MYGVPCTAPPTNTLPLCTCMAFRKTGAGTSLGTLPPPPPPPAPEPDTTAAAKGKAKAK